MGHFLLVVLSNRFRDEPIGLQAYRGHEFGVSGSRDVVGHAPLAATEGRYVRSTGVDTAAFGLSH